MRGRGNVPVAATAAAVGAALVFAFAFLVRTALGTAHHSTDMRNEPANVEEYLAQDALDGKEDSGSNTLSAHVSFQNTGSMDSQLQDTVQANALLTNPPVNEKQRSRRALEDILLEEGFHIDVHLYKRDTPQATLKTEDLKESLLEEQSATKNSAPRIRVDQKGQQVKRVPYEQILLDKPGRGIQVMKQHHIEGTASKENMKTIGRESGSKDTRASNIQMDHVTPPRLQNISTEGLTSKTVNGTLISTDNTKRRTEANKEAILPLLRYQMEQEIKTTHSESELDKPRSFTNESSNSPKIVTQESDFIVQKIKNKLKKTETEKMTAKTVLKDQRKAREALSNYFVSKVQTSDKHAEDYSHFEVDSKPDVDYRPSTHKTGAELFLPGQLHSKFHERESQRSDIQVKARLNPNNEEDLSDHHAMLLEPEKTGVKPVLRDHQKVTNTARTPRQLGVAGHYEETKSDIGKETAVGPLALNWWWWGSTEENDGAGVDEVDKDAGEDAEDDCPPVPPPELQVQRTPPLHSAMAHALRFRPELMCGLRCDCFHVRWMLQAEGEGTWAAGDAVWEAPWVALRGLRPDTLYAVAVWLRPHARAAQGDMRWFRALPARERTCPERAPRVRRLRARARPGGAQVEVRWAPPLPEGCRSALLLLARVATPRGVVRGAYDEGGGDAHDQQAEEETESEWNGPMPEWRLVGGYRVGGEPYGAVQECVDWPGQHCVELWRPAAAPRRMPLLAQVSVVRRGEEGDAGVGGWGNREAPPSAAAAQAWVEPVKEEGAEGDDARWAFAPHPDTVSVDSSGGGTGGGDGEGPGDAVGILLLLLAGMLLVMLMGSTAIACCVYRRRRRLEERAAQLAAALAGDEGIISAWG